LQSKKWYVEERIIEGGRSTPNGREVNWMQKTPEKPERYWKLRTCPWSEITEPGCYLFHNTGHLVRVPEDAVAPNRSPVVSISSRDEVWVTKLSPDPWIPISKARQICADNDLPVNF